MTMRIRTLLQTSVFVAIALVLGLSVASWFTTARLADISRAQERSQAIARDVSKLLVLTHEFALYSEERASQQWQVQHTSIVSMLEAGALDIVPAPPEAITEASSLVVPFQQLVTASAGNSDFHKRQKNLLLGQVLTNTQILADSVHRWSNATLESHRKTERVFRLLAIAIPLTMLLILALLSVLLFRRVLRPLAGLLRAVKAVQRGDLTVRYRSGVHDEFGELSRAFDSMAVDLVTELRQEIREHYLLETALEESNRKLEALSSTDGLTGIANRRCFDEVLAREYARNARSEDVLSLIMLDLDHFKAFNDRYGHIKGDECLRSVARVIFECVSRPADLCARYGGEEFACILPETDGNGAYTIAEEIRQGIIALAIPHGDSSVADHVTASFGVLTVRCSPLQTVEDAMAQVDALLYRAKTTGRNRVIQEKPHDIPQSDKSQFVMVSPKDA